MKSDKPSEDELLRAKAIASAKEFSAFFRAGPREKYIERGFPDYESAKTRMGELVAEHSKFGRGGMVYAITPQGYTMDCDDRMMALAEQFKSEESTI